jgi:hypothetical protein
MSLETTEPSGDDDAHEHRGRAVHGLARFERRPGGAIDEVHIARVAGVVAPPVPGVLTDVVPERFCWRPETMRLTCC